MSRIVTVYAIGDRDKALYPTEQLAAVAKAAPPFLEGEIRPVQFKLPEGAFWQGDIISVELHRGSLQNDEGISSGGKWTEPVVGYADVSVIVQYLDGNWEVSGAIREIGSDRHIQSMDLRAGKVGFPYRHAQLIRARGDAEDGSF